MVFHHNPFIERVQTVTELTRSIRGLLETQFPFVTVAGEISNLRQPHSGHFYFTLKDHESQIRAVLFKLQQRYLDRPPKEGMMAVCRGRVSVYESRGEYQLIVDTLENQGAGALQLAFEDLKRRLASEGLFETARKRRLPPFPGCIGLITSPTGAAIHDFLTSAIRRWPNLRVEVYPVRVQGDGAADDIVEAITAMNQRSAVEVLVLCRGGGSIEDLWPFNEERVARAIAHSRIPVVTGIGHEIDFTIADFAADFRALTPTAAAEAVLPEKAIVLKQLARLDARMLRAMRQRLVYLQERILTQKRLLRDPRLRLANQMLRTDHLQMVMLNAFARLLAKRRAQLALILHRFHQYDPAHQQKVAREKVANLSARQKNALERLLQEKRSRLAHAVSVLQAVNPHAVMERGYAIVREKRSGTVIHESKQVAPGSWIDIILHRGSLTANVMKTEEPL